MTDYPLTLADVKVFLETKQDDEPLGLCFNAAYCLLSEVLNWRYPLAQPWRVDIGTYSSPLVPAIRLDPALDFLRSSFDYSVIPGKGENWRLVTKARFKRHLESLASRQAAQTDENRMPFALADLFSEA